MKFVFLALRMDEIPMVSVSVCDSVCMCVCKLVNLNEQNNFVKKTYWVRERARARKFNEAANVFLIYIYPAKNFNWLFHQLILNALK